MKKLVYPVMLVLFFVFLIGCETEIKEISMVKCRSCGEILEGPDTTIVKGHYNRDKGILTTTEGKIYHLAYYEKVINAIDDSTAVCEKCRKKFKKEAVEYFKKGKREYAKGNWMQAENYFNHAIGVLPNEEKYAEAEKWLEKTKKKWMIVREKEERRELRKWIAEAEKERVIREREEKKQELADRYVESGIRFGIVSSRLRQMRYDLKYRTLSSQIQSKAREISKYVDDVFVPTLDEFGYYLNKYIDKYGIKEARDLAIMNGFIHVFKY
ncbi:hypothetical protein ES703_66871 [subsurface metagenome]